MNFRKIKKASVLNVNNANVSTQLLAQTTLRNALGTMFDDKSIIVDLYIIFNLYKYSLCV